MALKLKLEEHQNESTSEENKFFIPIDILNSLLTQDAIEKELQTYGITRGRKDLSSYVKDIHTKAKKIFAVLLCRSKGDSIFSFIDEGIGDKDLPLRRCEPRNAVSLGANNHALRLCIYGHQGCGLRSTSVESGWSRQDVRDFCRDQWLVLAPVFQQHQDGPIPHFELEDNVILPFIEEDKCQISSGGYGRVWKVKIHVAHQKLYTSNSLNANEPLLAIKELHSSDPSEFQKESDMLCALATGNHKHLIKLLATYKFRGRYHLLFPYADNNLRGYWDHIGVPYWNRETCLWFLNQASGIASALNAIHNFEARVPLGSEQDRRGKYLTVAIAEAKFGRHGDIKPENILWFNEMQDAEHGGILQIADFGLGRFHRLESRSKVDPRSVAGSLSYSPPEVALGKAVSRAYDMWSLGCVFLEFVTWLLEGSSSIYKFSDQRLSKALDGAQDDTFFSLTTDGKITTGAVMRGGVTSWIDRLRKHPQYSEMVRDLLDIVQNHLLVIDTERRMKSDVLYKQLNKILNRAKTEEKYLLGDVRTQKSADYTLARSNDTKVDGPLIRVVECK